MGFLHKLWDETLAGPAPDSGLRKLRKYDSFSASSTSRPISLSPPIITRSITIVRTSSDSRCFSDSASFQDSPSCPITPRTPCMNFTDAASESLFIRESRNSKQSISKILPPQVLNPSAPDITLPKSPHLSRPITSLPKPPPSLTFPTHTTVSARDPFTFYGAKMRGYDGKWQSTTARDPFTFYGPIHFHDLIPLMIALLLLEAETTSLEHWFLGLIFKVLWLSSSSPSTSCSSFLVWPQITERLVS